VTVVVVVAAGVGVLVVAVVAPVTVDGGEVWDDHFRLLGLQLLLRLAHLSYI
jgi:hypothetical protein